MRSLRAAEQALDKAVKARDIHNNLNAFVSRTSPDAAVIALKSNSSARNLSGTFIAVKDNISTSDLPTTCASKGLENYTSAYDATVVSRAKVAGSILIGKTNLDEFGMGSHSTNSAFGVVSAQGPNGASALSAGGSSGGSAVAVATGQCDLAVGTDTGGSVRLPAAYNDVFAFKPSYGLVSRWGVVAYANSLDTVGFMGRHVDSLRTLFHECNAYDPKDPTSLRPSTRLRLGPSRFHQCKRLRIGVPSEYNIVSLSGTVRDSWLSTLKALQSQGHTLHAVSLPSTASALSAYYVLAPAEASSNLAKYDSVRYGVRPPPKQKSDAPAAQEGLELAQQSQSGSGGELFAHSRAYGFGAEVRRRILLGSYTLSAKAMDNYFRQAQRVRRLVQRDFDAVFATPNPLHEHLRHGTDGMDVLIAPTAPRLPPRLKDVETESEAEGYAGDVFTVPASLAGLPVVNIPVKAELVDCDRRSIGFQIMGQFGDDELVLDFVRSVQHDLCHVNELQ